VRASLEQPPSDDCIETAVRQSPGVRRGDWRQGASPRSIVPPFRQLPPEPPQFIVQGADDTFCVVRLQRTPTTTTIEAYSLWVNHRPPDELRIATGSLCRDIVERVCRSCSPTIGGTRNFECSDNVSGRRRWTTCPQELR